MGRRALRTGDLVTPRFPKYLGGPSDAVPLWREPEKCLDSSDIVVNCQMGLLLGTISIEWRPGHYVTKAMVLDNVSGKFGWCDLKFLRRVD